MIKIKLSTIFLLLLILGCATAQIAPDAAELSVDFSWKGIERCSKYSPQIRIKDIPTGTKYFEVKLKDLDARGWNHGGGKVENNDSGIIQAGALRSGYNGPCPPSGSHPYQFTVKAVNEEGIIIGIGKAVKEFP
jgi:phosphatidylethanolamine-binding protein (PEBP) family uncharacterized protein